MIGIAPEEIRKRIIDAGLDIINANVKESMLHHNSVIIEYYSLDELIKSAKALNVSGIFWAKKGMIFFVAGGTFFHLLTKA